jgi:hypothetical protein
MAVLENGPSSLVDLFFIYFFASRVMEACLLGRAVNRSFHIGRLIWKNRPIDSSRTKSIHETQVQVRVLAGSV